MEKASHSQKNCLQQIIIFLCNLPWERCALAHFAVLTSDATDIPGFITSALIYCVQLKYLYRPREHSILCSPPEGWIEALQGDEDSECEWSITGLWQWRRWQVVELTSSAVSKCVNMLIRVNVQSKDNQIGILHWDVSADIIEICLFILWRHLEHYLLHCTPTDSQDPLLFSRMSFKKGRLQGKISQASKCLWITSDG